MKNKAFTLVETLIALVIIGTIASLVIPTIINKNQKIKYSIALKKEYISFNQAIKKAMINDETFSFEGTKLFNSFNQDAEFKKELNKVFKINNTNPDLSKIKCGKNTTPSYKNLNNKGCHVIQKGFKVAQLADGAIIYFNFTKNKSKNEKEDITKEGGKLTTQPGWVAIDINGAKNPNTLGRDLFHFAISEKGELFPLDGKDFAIFNTNPVGRWEYNTWKSKGTCNPARKDEYGRGCAARIMDNSWEMDY